MNGSDSTQRTDAGWSQVGHMIMTTRRSEQTLERANYLKCIQTTVESMHKG